MEKVKSEFGFVRGLLFPIRSYEFRKIIPLFFLFMFISGAYYLLRSLKDMLLMSYTGRAETLYFLKVYAVTPFMIILTIIYSKFSGLHRDSRFFIVVGYFFGIIASCYYIFLPNLELFRLDGFADKLIELLPSMRDLWEAIRFWPCSLIYLNAEAWGSMALGVLFWTFCNDVISFKDSKRVYAFLASGAAVGTFFAGLLVKEFIKEDFNLGVGYALMCVGAVLIIYFLISNQVKSRPELYLVEDAAPKKKKVKMSFMDSLKFLASSKHLTYIAIIVLSYGSFISLFEAVAKAQTTKLVAIIGKSALSEVYGLQGMANGVLSIMFVFLSPWASKKGWTYVAIITPAIAIVCTGLFFLFLFSGNFFAFLVHSEDAQIAATNILWMAVIFGIANQVTIKAAKYIMFDATCNQAYIPLDADSKIRGKAAVDGVGSRLGKSIGSLAISAPMVGLVSIFGSIDNSKVAIAIIIGFILFMWLSAVTKLGSLLKTYEKNEEKK